MYTSVTASGLKIYTYTYFRHEKTNKQFFEYILKLLGKKKFSLKDHLPEYAFST